MKYLQMIGLTAIAAAALMGVAGAGTASATVLCHSTSTPCGEKWKAGTEPRFIVKPGTAGIWRDTSGGIAANCPEGELRGTITNAGSSTETVKASIPASGLTWKNVEGCIATNTLEGGTIEVHAISGSDNGTVTVSGVKITISILGASCIYGFGEHENFGTLTASGSGSAVLDINTFFLKKEGGVLCPSQLTWAEEFEQEKPSGTPLYVEPS
ncbi:MAG: hypothetical protein ACTHNP_13645 [Solirubrobacterales bacterium]